MRDIETLQNHSTLNATPKTNKQQGLGIFIMSHPLLERIGHYYFQPFSGKQQHIDINRTTPQFAPSAMPLADPYINRSAISIDINANQQITLTKQSPKLELLLNNERLNDSMILDPQKLLSGIVIQLNQRICLLIKTCPPIEHIDHQRFLMRGLSHSLLQTCQHIAFLSPTNEPVLIRGSTGTGKELVAKAIVKNSPRKDKPFICVNLAAISPSLAAAELFGSSKGAFTGAQKQRNGFMQAANGGTLFLDEIGEANAEVQALLLRVLETGELFPVGSTEPVQVDVRIIAATDAKLDDMITKGQFKAPLLYRLANFELKLEDLSARQQDIAVLFAHFARQICQELNISPPQNLLEASWVPSQLMQTLIDYHWPGNIRQLRNLVRQIIISAHTSPVLSLPTDFAVKNYSSAMQQLTEPKPEPDKSQVEPQKPKQSKRKPATITKDELLSALQLNDFEISKTAHTLNTSRASVYQLLKQYQVPNINNINDQQILQLLEQQQDINTVAKQLKVSPSALRRRINQLRA